MSGISGSLTSAVGGPTPPGIGEVAGRARDPPVPSALSHNAGPALLREHQFLAQLVAGDPKGTKRAADGPSPASLPVGKKKKKKGGKKASKKVKAAKPPKTGRSGAVNDSDLFAMMQLVAGRHGWSIGDPPTPASQGLTQTALDPATSAPPPAPLAGQAASYPQAALYTMTTAPPPGYPAGQQPPIFPPHRAPAALGAPPGEEVFPLQAPPCQRTSLHSLRAPFPRRRPVQTGLPCKKRHRRPGRVVGNFRGPVHHGPGGDPRPKTPQRGGRISTPPILKGVLCSVAGRCGTAAPRLTAIQNGGGTRPGHPADR